MSTVAVRELRNQLADLLGAVHFGGERVVIEKRGKPIAALICFDEFQLFEQLEDAMDLAAAKEALAEGKAVPFDDVMKELGLNVQASVPKRRKARTG